MAQNPTDRFAEYLESFVELYGYRDVQAAATSTTIIWTWHDSSGRGTTSAKWDAKWSRCVGYPT
jgi:hypothetical protein